MTTPGSSTRSNVDTVLRFFRIGDGLIEADMSSIFSDDIQVYFPKFGIGHGKAAVQAVGAGRYEIFPRFMHHHDDFKVYESGNTVVVEGTSEGETRTGRASDGRKTVAGHFCGVFEVGDGLITRMHIYTDPDLGHEDTSRYPWHQD